MSDTTTPATRDFQGLQIPTPGTYAVDTSHSELTFSVRHMMVSKVRGRFGDVEGTVTIAEDPLQSSVTASITTASVQTGNVDRDNHLRTGDFFEAEKYPEITFRSTRVKSHDGAEFVLEGELTIKDVTRPVELQVEFEGVGKSPYGFDVFGFSASTEIDREDWGLTYNMALESGGVMIGKKVKIEIEGEAIRQA